MTFPRFLLAVLLPVAFLLVPGPALAARPVKDVVLFRADLSVAPSSYIQRFSTEDAQGDDSFAFTLGPRLGLNLGWAPTRLIRLGIGGAAAFSMSVAEDENIASVELDGWARWTVGPSVGFRFGPKVPLELDIAVNFANFQSLGTQATPTAGSPDSFDALAKQYGMTSTALLLFRPGGADSPFALHAGLEGTWGMATATTTNDGQSSATGFIQSLLLGVSFGL